MPIHLQTNRLALREVLMDDLEDIHALHGMPEVDRYNTLGLIKDIAQSKKMVSEWVDVQSEAKWRSYVFSVFEKQSRSFIGLLALNLHAPKKRSGEVWYKLHPDFWGKGYATEALQQLLNYAFDKLYAHRIEAGCAVGNLASIKVLEKVGMTREGSKRQALPIRGEWVDNYEYAILSSDPRP